MRNKMSYLKTIEFLVQELAKKDEQIEGLIRNDEDNQSVIKRLNSIHDKHMEMLSDKDNEVEDLEATLEFTEHKLKEMTAELKETKEMNLKINDKLDETRADYLSESDLVVALQEEIEFLNDKVEKYSEPYDKAWATDFAYKHLKKAYDSNNSYYEERIAKLQVEINNLKNNQ